LAGETNVAVLPGLGVTIVTPNPQGAAQEGPRRWEPQALPQDRPSHSLISPHKGTSSIQLPWQAVFQVIPISGFELGSLAPWFVLFTTRLPPLVVVQLNTCFICVVFSFWKNSHFHSIINLEKLAQFWIKLNTICILIKINTILSGK
jgi:hypothetical protein